MIYYKNHHLEKSGVVPVHAPAAATDPVASETAVIRNSTGGEYFNQHVVATLPAPWSMAFMPDGRLLITERPPAGPDLLNPTAEGHVRIVTQSGQVSSAITGLPENVGILDVELDPNFSQNHLVYFSYLERDPNAPRVGRAAGEAGIDPAGLAVARGVLDSDGPSGPALTSTSIIWRQQPKIVAYPGSGEPGGRMAFSPDGAFLFVAAGDRQEFDPVQSLANTLGKTIRIHPDGTIPLDNPFVGMAGALPEIWTLGHRNPYGLTFNPSGELWENEMGPMGGDELNVIRGGANYGWPFVSYGDHYGGPSIPRPSPGDGYEPSPLWWNPVIAPSGMIFYSGSAFPQWQGDAIISGLQSKGLVIVDTEGTSASEIARIDLGARTRDIAQGPDGTLWILYDQPDGRLVQLSPIGSNPFGNGSHDFNGDGRDDILWRHANGEFGDWLGAPGGGFTYNAAAGGTQVPADWRIAGIGDFDRDGRDDILWRNDDGRVGDWLATVDGAFVYNGAAGLAPAGLDWHIAGIADFDGDDRDDILWRNDTGEVGEWLATANGGFAYNAAVGGIPVSNDWHIAGTGDFDGDGRDDILWRNNDGTFGDWLAQANGGFVYNDAAGGTSVPNDWRIAATGDYNRDGRDDILWRNDNGVFGDWLAQPNGGFAYNAAAGLTAVSNDWHIVATGDYNGDGRDDILWRNDDGTLGNWLAQADGGFAYNAPAGVTQVSNSWHAQPAGYFFV